MMRDNNIHSLYNQARTWVQEATELVRTLIHEPMDINTKSDRNDLVTSADQHIEYFFAEKIRHSYPDHMILSEEGYGDHVTSLDGTVWIIDPIDGTMNFVHQQAYFCISVGIYIDGIGEIGFIYDVMDDVLYEALRGEGAYKNNTRLKHVNEHLNLEDAMLGMNHFWLCPNRLIDEKWMQRLVKTVRGTRTYGSAAMEFAYAAEGKVDGYLALGLSGWDIAAGIVIAGETGCITTDIDGYTVNMLTNGAVFVCNPSIHKVILDSFIRPGRKPF